MVSKGAEGPQKLRGNGEGLDKVLSWAAFSKWAKSMALQIWRFKSLPYLEIHGEKKHYSFVKSGHRQAISSVTLKGKNISSI